MYYRLVQYMVNSAIALLRSGVSIRKVALKISLIRKVTKDPVSNAAKVTKLLEKHHRIKVNPGTVLRVVLREAG
ncbi:hypothetical protein HMPREF1544_10337 [Mucor circinelloides 1006PhL]|uniref:Uncharacterized protein n=1 Tax=Mucor circinelloides f. circinelloides (strain 1006PhL) TaxID=1220926 RepID=S2IYP6_MUCC1|nr:hypothetical protein HMPREF1544_10337 [Mucor circinelloides 1006PhL]